MCSLQDDYFSLFVFLTQHEEVNNRKPTTNSQVDKRLNPEEAETVSPWGLKTVTAKDKTAKAHYNARNSFTAASLRTDAMGRQKVEDYETRDCLSTIYALDSTSQEGQKKINFNSFSFKSKIWKDQWINGGKSWAIAFKFEKKSKPHT